MEANNAGDHTYPHQPVLYHEVLSVLRPRSGGHYIDATVGAGGHSRGILESSRPDGSLLGFEIDPQALAIASQRLSVYKDRVTLVQASYTTLLDEMQRLGWPGVDGIVIDLGVSSMQVDSAGRGFSFQADGPLDMRFSPMQTVTAAHLVNTLDEVQLADILWRYGEELQSRQIARAICANRPFESTLQLADLIKRVGKRSHDRIHPATRTFQALRIAVNQELQAIEVFLPQAVEALLPGGILAVISFHSLEDRLVKQYFRRESKDCLCPPRQTVCTCGHRAQIVEVSRRPIVAAETEVSSNPRARSAKLRVVQKKLA